MGCNRCVMDCFTAFAMTKGGMSTALSGALSDQTLPPLVIARSRRRRGNLWPALASATANALGATVASWIASLRSQ
ncbi:hypothetical protein [Tsuneonella suprasediminis]|uniref:hypothetical protein n=1 Tax=Tsuneonella suprasediminis TaxID=2306996 RepID=UPI003B8393FF